MASEPNQNVFQTEGKPEHPEETYADTGKTCRFHTHSDQSWESNPGPWCCEAAVPTTVPPRCPGGSGLELAKDRLASISLSPLVETFLCLTGSAVSEAVATHVAKNIYDDGVFLL